MDIARNLLKVLIGIDQKGFIAPLIQMARSLMFSIKIGSVRNIEMPHKFLKVGHGGLDQQVEMIGHQDIT